jgi:phasin family protein
MFQQNDNLQQFFKQQNEAAVRSMSVLTKGVQALLAEVADASKRSFEHNTAALESMIGAKSVDKLMAVQSDYLKGSQEILVAQTTKIGELCTNLAKEAYKPYEGLIAQATSSVKAA